MRSPKRVVNSQLTRLKEFLEKAETYTRVGSASGVRGRGGSVRNSRTSMGEVKKPGGGEGEVEEERVMWKLSKGTREILTREIRRCLIKK